MEKKQVTLTVPGKSSLPEHLQQEVVNSTISALKEEQLTWAGMGRSSCGKEKLTFVAWERSSLLELVRGEGAA
jgi:hypothetical protein